MKASEAVDYEIREITRNRITRKMLSIVRLRNVRIPVLDDLTSKPSFTPVDHKFRVFSRLS